MSSSNQDTLTDFKITQIDSSDKLPPLRIHFTVNEHKKCWDLVKSNNDASVLVYNKTRKVVLFIKQFRPSLYCGQMADAAKETVIDTDKCPVSEGYALELAFGVVDKGLSVEDVAQKAVLEKFGYDVPVDSLRKIFNLRSVGVFGNESAIYYVEVEDKQKIGKGVSAHSEELATIVEMTVEQFKEYINSGDLKSTSGFVAAGLWFFSNVKVT